MWKIPWLLCIVTGIADCQRVSNARINNLYGYNEPPDIQNMFLAMQGILRFLQDGDRFDHLETEDINPASNLLQEYDFIVVGGGTAGCVVASRLTEIPDVTVLLIEAGSTENLLMDIPVLVSYLQLSNEINWKYKTMTSDKYCIGLKDSQCNYPRGKVMGGSSVLNYMIATRAHPNDYDLWAEAGNYGWSYEEVLPYFKKLESAKSSEFSNDTENRGQTGPMPISFTPFYTPLAEAFMQAGREMGYEGIDYNSRDFLGFSRLQTTTFNGTRYSANKAYLQPVKNRANLHVSQKSMVSRVLFDSDKTRAIGVEFIKAAQRRKVYARKEVILCTGAIGSPQILMLSGIGPKDHLEEIGIEVLRDAPVGENLMDHISYGGFAFLVNESVSLRTQDLFNPMYPFMKDFFHNRQGPFTIPGTTEALAFLNIDDLQDREGLPNMEILFSASSIVSDPAFHIIFGIDHHLWEKCYRKIENHYAFTLYPILLKPKSRGWIKLRDKNIRTYPEIVANYMDDLEDVRLLIKGVRMAIKISKTKAMQKYGASLYNPEFPHCKRYKYDSDAYWECALRLLTFNMYHYSGTCKMGAVDDPTAVVDPKLQVIGVQGLRVADASIMPDIVSGHTNLPVLMIAEKLADMLKDDWNLKSKHDQ